MHNEMNTVALLPSALWSAVMPLTEFVAGYLTLAKHKNSILIAAHSTNRIKCECAERHHQRNNRRQHYWLAIGPPPIAPQNWV